MYHVSEESGGKGGELAAKTTKKKARTLGDYYYDCVVMASSTRLGISRVWLPIRLLRK